MSQPNRTARVRDVFAVWWPLAASWLLMAFEVPVVSAALARFPYPEIQLAAFGGIVYPLMLLIESPVIMLLAASTALSRDWPSYRALRRYTHTMSAALTALHLVVAATPVYGLVTGRLIEAPAAIVGPARLGLMIALPWTWAIALRRFQQGILIRHGASRAIGAGTLLRLASTGTTLALAWWLARTARWPGVAFGTGAVIVGVTCEALFIGWRTRPLLEGFFGRRDGDAPGRGEFARFYVPLALTALLSLLIQPLGSAAISRMPRPLESLAVWPVVVGLVFMLRSGGTAYKEVVVAMLERPGGLTALRRFTLLLGGGILAATVAIAFTPLADWWLESFSGLPPGLARMATGALRIAIVLPVGGVLQNYYVGYLVHARRTRAVTESMIAFLTVAVTLMAAGVAWGELPGLYVAFGAFTCGNLTQLFWVWRRARAGLQAHALREMTRAGA